MLRNTHLGRLKPDIELYEEAVTELIGKETVIVLLSRVDARPDRAIDEPSPRYCQVERLNGVSDRATNK